MRVGYDYEAEYRRLGIGKPPCCQSRVGRITSSLGRTRDRRVQRGSEKREIDGQDPCRQLSSERPTELALLSQVVRTEFFAERNYMAAPVIAGEFDCEESPKTKAAQTARILTETTTLPLSEIAFAAGFASIRQFNSTMHEVFAATPTQLRSARGTRGARSWRLGVPPGPDPSAPGLIRLRLAYRTPIDLDRMFGFLTARAIPGVEAAGGDRYSRTIQLPNGTGIVSLGPFLRPRDPGYLDCELQLEDLRDLTAARQRWRRSPCPAMEY